MCRVPNLTIFRTVEYWGTIVFLENKNGSQCFLWNLCTYKKKEKRERGGKKHDKCNLILKNKMKLFIKLHTRTRMALCLAEVGIFESGWSLTSKLQSSWLFVFHKWQTQLCQPVTLHKLAGNEIVHLLLLNHTTATNTGNECFQFVLSGNMHIVPELFCAGLGK